MTLFIYYFCQNKFGNIIFVKKFWQYFCQNKFNYSTLQKIKQK